MSCLRIDVSYGASPTTASITHIPAQSPRHMRSKPTPTMTYCKTWWTAISWHTMRMQRHKRLRGEVLTTRRYTKLRLPLPLPCISQRGKVKLSKAHIDDCSEAKKSTINSLKLCTKYYYSLFPDTMLCRTYYINHKSLPFQRCQFCRSETSSHGVVRQT